MTCCWRCWMPTSCTAPVCLARPPSRSPLTRGRLLLSHTALLAAPQTLGLPAALEAEVTRSNRVRIQTQWIFTAFAENRNETGETFYWNVLRSAEFCKLSSVCTNSGEPFKSAKLNFKTLLCRQTKHGVSVALAAHSEKPEWNRNMKNIAVIIWPVAPAPA